MISTSPEQIGKYRIVREVGRGATSVVYLARDLEGERDVAIKVVQSSSGSDTDLQRRFRRVFLNEAALVGKLFHPHILAIHDAVSEEGGQSYIVMEYVDGRTLEHCCDVAELLPVNKVVEIIFKCSLALAFAQRHGVIHCDIKPANILVGANDEIKISDFGAALNAQAEHTHLKGVGSPAYMSPEQVQDRELDFRTDIYSLGVVMYQLLTGKLPFRASSKASLLYQVLNIVPPLASSFRHGIPEELDRLVARCLEKDPEARFASWAEFSRELTDSYRHLEAPADDTPDAERFEVLRRLSFFRGCKDRELWEAARMTEWRQFEALQTVVKEGELGDSFFIITSGEAKVSKNGRLLNILREGDCFGEMLYFAETSVRRTTSISSLTGLGVIEVKANDLAHASDALQNEMNKAFLRILIDRLSWANNNLAAA